jgi:hypothetical protein
MDRVSGVRSYEYKVVVKLKADSIAGDSGGLSVGLEDIEPDFPVFEMSTARNGLYIHSPRPGLIEHSDHRRVVRHHIATIVDI